MSRDPVSVVFDPRCVYGEIETTVHPDTGYLTATTDTGLSFDGSTWDNAGPPPHLPMQSDDKGSLKYDGLVLDLPAGTMVTLRAAAIRRGYVYAQKTRVVPIS